MQFISVFIAARAVNDVDHQRSTVFIACNYLRSFAPTTIKKCLRRSDSGALVVSVLRDTGERLHCHIGVGSRERSEILRCSSHLAGGCRSLVSTWESCELVEDADSGAWGCGEQVLDVELLVLAEQREEDG
jgi:hypothetical protein